MSDESSHWYLRDGTPFYTVVGSNGVERPATLRDARKEGAVPSVTTVTSIKPKPNLERWKRTQAILAALTLPRKEGESDEEFIKRIEEDAKAQAKAAADEGARIHDALEKAVNGERYPSFYDPHVEATLKKLHEIFPGVSDWVAEKSFCSALGYGGKVDLHSPSTGITVDYKGKDGDFSDGKRLAYDQDLQLAPYQRGLGLPLAPCANIFVSRTHPGKVSEHIWKPEQLEEAWYVFEGLLESWKRLKRYDPSFDPK